MGIHSGSRVVVDRDLILYVDSLNTSSYRGTTSTWYDISGNNNDFTTAFTPPTYVDNVFQFAVGQSLDNSINLNRASGLNSTIITACRFSGVSTTSVFTSPFEAYRLGNYGGYIEYFKPAGSGIISGINDSNIRTQWRIYAATNNHTTDVFNFYVNGYLRGSITDNTSSGPNGLKLNVNSNCQVGFVMVYKRILTNEEILRNTMAMRGRYNV